MTTIRETERFRLRLVSPDSQEGEHNDAVRFKETFQPFAWIDDGQPDAVLLWDPTGTVWTELAQPLRASYPLAPLLVLSHVDEAPNDAFASGVRDWLYIPALSETGLARAIRAAVLRERAVLGERSSTENATADSQLKNIITRNADGIMVIDRQGNIRFANPAAEEMFGRPASALEGQPFGYPIAAESAAEVELTPERGVLQTAEMRVVPCEWDGEPAHLASLRNISERKRAEEQLAGVLRAISAHIAVLDAKGVITAVNEAWLKFADKNGAPPKSAVGVGADYLEVCERGAAQQDESAREAAAGIRAVLAGENAQFVLEYPCHSPNEQRWFILYATPLGGETGGAVVTHVDISERKQLQQDLARAQKMEAIGQLAGGVAHDFNNLLTAILGSTEFLMYDVAKDDPMLEGLTEIKDAGERAAALTRQLLAFSRKQVLQPEVLDLNSLITEILKMLRRLIGENVEITTDLDPDLGSIKADPSQIEQVVLNLALNARDAMPDGGTLTISTANTTVSKEACQHTAGFRPGDYVVLSVRDTGEGMDAHVRERAFDPFFTTKKQGQGTGLGLSTVYGIVRQSEGTITVDSQPKRGSEFRVYLPRSGEDREETPDEQASERGPKGEETILVVEDEEIVRTLVCRVLISQGYNVLEARNGAAAILLAQQAVEPIHLLLTDVIMPYMSGRELARHLGPLYPRMRVLYMSGYTDDAILNQGVLDRNLPFLQKPFSPETLARRVRDVLDQPRATTL